MPSVICPQCSKPTSSGLCAGVCPECLAASLLDSWDDPGDTNEPASEEIITRVADYDVLRVIGRGGMGVVCRARDRLLGREVALKLIHSGVLASDEELRRFRLEAETVASLRHPHLITVHETGEADGQLYFTMTLAENGTLAARIHSAGRLQARDAAQLVRDIALAVHHAHTRGVLHRDLKPANILFDAEGCALVSDFGLARFTGDPSVTKSGSLLGTPAYLAPEVVAGTASHTTSSDVYALGVILFESLTGRPPFENDSALALLKIITEDEVPAPSNFVKDIDHDLEAVCLKALNKDPSQRYASAEAFADDLGRWLADEPVTARHPPITERLWRWSHRNQTRAVLYSMAVLSVVILVVLSAIWNIILATEKSETAEAMRQSEVRRAVVLRDYGAQLMTSASTMLRARPPLTEAASLSSRDAFEDRAVNLRLRVLQRLAPLTLQEWKVATLAPVLAWSPDSRTAACTDNGTTRTFDLDSTSLDDPMRATLTETHPNQPMPLPDDGNNVRRALWSPDGKSVLIHTRSAVILWHQARPLTKWTGPDLKAAWFDSAGRLVLKTSSATLQLHSDGSITPAEAVEPAPTDASQRTSYVVTTESTGFTHIWRDATTTVEAFDPIAHPCAVTASAFNFNQRYLATITQDKTLRVWELSTGLLMTPPLPLDSDGGKIVWDETRQSIAVWTDHDVVYFDW